MALTRKFLTDAGLESDVISEIMKEHGKSLTELNDKVGTLEDDLKTANRKLETSSSSSEPSEDVQAIKDALQNALEQNETLKENHEQQLKQIKMNGAIDSALTGKARDVELVRSLLDYDTLSLDESGTVQGLDEQVEKIKVQRAFLFDQETKKEQTPAITGTKPVEGSPPSPQGYKEQYDQALKSGDTLQAIAIKNRAFAEGQGFN